MLACALSLALLLTQAPAPVSVDQYLRSRPDLQRHHKGYLHYLRQHPELAEIERQWWKENLQGDFAPLIAQGETALQGDASAQQAFDAFYRDLAAGGGDRWRDMLNQLQQDPVAQQPPVQNGINYLRQNPGALLPMIQGGSQESPVPELEPLRQFALQNPALLQQLGGLLGGLLENSGETGDSNWTDLLRAPAAAAGSSPYGALAQHFQAHPERFRLWHQRNAQLAEDAHAAEWIRWWEARVRRDPMLGANYFGYLLQTADAEFGPKADALAALWPPPGPPPAQPPSTPQVSAPTQHQIERPRKPTIQRPTKPLKPDRPTRGDIQMRQPRSARERLGE